MELKPEIKLISGALITFCVLLAFFMVVDTGIFREKAPTCECKTEDSVGRKLLVSTELDKKSIFEGEIAVIYVTIDNLDVMDIGDKESVEINLYAESNIALEGEKIYVGKIESKEVVTKGIRLTGLVRDANETETYDIKVTVEGYTKDFSHFEEVSTAFLMITKPR